MSTRETILAAVATALAGVASGRIYRSRKEQLSTLPAVIITPDQEQAEEVVLGKTDRRLTVAIAVFASADTPDAGADSTLASCWSALAVANALGLGSDVQVDPAHEITWEWDDYDYVRATLRVTINYRTDTGSM